MAPFQIHSATTSHGSIGLNGDLGYHQHVWQSRMESSILFQHQLMRKKLAVSYVAAGDFGSPDIRLPMPGNFWWVRSDHVVALPNLRGSTEWSNCWNAEHWIGRNGMNEFDLFDYGERDLEGFHLASTGGLAAGVTTNRHNGCFLQGALVPRKWRYNRLISAHAPATISIEVKIPITLYGILSDTGDPNHGHWLAEFKVNDVSLATLDDTIRKTREITLSSGLHELEIDRIRNRHHAGSTFRCAHRVGHGRRLFILMKILVTGGAGFIGSNLVRQLCEAGHSVLNLDKLTYAANLDSLSDLDKSLHRHVPHDITDAELVRADFRVLRPDWVIHLAAESHVDRSIDAAGAFVQTNIIGTFTLLQAAREHYEGLPAEKQSQFRFLHVSTDEVYGSLPETGAFSESSRYDPHSPYSASKAASDHLVRVWFHTYGLPTLITNCSNNYGPHQFPEKLIPLAILKAIRSEEIPVYGNGENVRDWLHVDDHARALIQVIEHGRPGETYNVGGSNERRNIDLIRLLCRILDDLHPSRGGRPYADQIQFVSDRPGHDQRYAIDSSKLRDELGWRPVWNGDAGFISTVQWYLNRRDWWQPILDGSYLMARLGSKKLNRSSRAKPALS